MHQIADDNEVRAVFSLKPLIDFWACVIAPSDPHLAGLWGAMSKDLEEVPELNKPVEDLSLLAPHWGLVRRLMSVVFPAASWESEMVGALVPFTLRPVFVSPLFERLLLNGDGSFRGRLRVDWDSLTNGWSIRFYLLILRKYYGIQKDIDYRFISIVDDPETGLERYFRLVPDFRFVDVQPVGELKKLSNEDLKAIQEHLTEPEVLGKFLPQTDFKVYGFTTIRALDVTESEVISYLEKSLIDKHSVFSPTAFMELQQQLRTFFKIPDLVAGISAIQEDRDFLLNPCCDRNCGFSCSRSEQIPIGEFAGALREQAVKEARMVRIHDLCEEPHPSCADQEWAWGEIRSLLLAPLFYQGEQIGLMCLESPRPGTLGPAEEMLAAQITPLFSVALNRALEELENRVQAIIKEKCTAVHPAVEWMFRENVFRHLERLHRGEASELEPIVFRDVYPFSAASDIRGSSEERSRAIQDDLAEHLVLALKVIDSALQVQRLDILEELSFRIRETSERVREGLGRGDEASAIHLLREEVEPLFPFVQGLGPGVAEAVATYEQEMDQSLRTVYRKRRDSEESIALLNERMSAYLESEEAHLQTVFPHYFNKHQTDGLDYIIYLGASMLESGEVNEMYLRNLHLWQLMVACGIDWHAERLKPTLKVPLDVTHIILVNNSPMSIRFRFDEKRFDVDGAYDVGHEIVRSRIDKAMIKGRDERLTQPHKIAIVYARLQEADEMRRHIDFLSRGGYLTDEVESLELDDLPGVQGLRAMRVQINIASPRLAERCQRRWDPQDRSTFIKGAYPSKPLG